MILPWRNKGELSEIFALCKIIHERVISYGDLNAMRTDDSIQVTKIHFNHANINLSDTQFSIQNIDANGQYTGSTTNHLISEFITIEELDSIVDAIKKGSKTFSHQTLDDKIESLGMIKTKGDSYEKSDVLLSFVENSFIFEHQGTSIKSFLGSSPTLLNASQATNFIYEVKGLTLDNIELINSIGGRSKIKDRVDKIYELGGSLTFFKCENPVYESTLKKVDTDMPQTLADALLYFFKKEINNRLSSYPELKITDSEIKDQKICRLKDFVKATMLGIFPTKEWDGNITANSVVLINNEGDLVFYHTNKEAVLKDFFYKQTFFDTPSSSRHRFGSIFKETNGKYYFT